MDMKEHIYTDDPTVGHPDVRTYLAGVDYFFIGNGLIQAAVQVCRSCEGTPLGLLILNPDRFGPKRAALTCFDAEGVTGTIISVRVNGTDHTPAGNELNAQWDDVDGVPAACVTWSAGNLDVQERFYCPGLSSPRIHRRITVSSAEADNSEILLLTGDSDKEGQPVTLSPNCSATVCLLYEVVRDDGEPLVVTRWKEHDRPSAYSTDYWTGLTHCHTGDTSLDHLFASARCQMPAAVDAIGRMDGSIWQYNLEWVRDQAHVTEALVRLGDYDLARTMLARLLDDFVSESGDVIDSGQYRDPIEVELDQNGELLTALKTYVDWTGDLDLLRERWGKVTALASFPLQESFCHEESGLLHNAREYWERHGGFGILDGFELMHQFFVALGLESAVYLSERTGNRAETETWKTAAERLRYGLLEDPQYRLIENGHFIKRRGIDGVWQKTITRPDDCVLPPEIPLMEDGPRSLDPDTSSVLPIAYAFIDPNGDLASNTLAHMEETWNQRWDDGGYGRYNAESEADSAGPWPFASLFVARAYVEAGDHDNVWRILRWLSNAPSSRAGSWFEFYGNRIAPPYAQNGIIPWTWAEMATLFVHHLVGVRPDLDGVTIRPFLLNGLDQMNATVRVREHRLNIDVRRAASVKERRALAGTESYVWQDGKGVRMPLPTSNVDVTVLC